MKNLFYLLLAGALALGSCGNDDEPEPIAVGGVTLDKTELTFHRGESATLTATVAPADAADKRIAWRSSDTNIATVNDKGLVSAVEPGTATITAAGGGKSATCTVNVEPDVYVVGYKMGPDPSQCKGMLWKNGVAQEIPLGMATSVFVSEGDVYISGTFYQSINRNLGVVKNGVREEWGIGRMPESSIFVSDGDVYVANNTNTTGYLWKNKVQNRIDPEVLSSFAFSVFVSGQDVYVGGNRLNSMGETTATYWKNGIANDLSDGSAYGLLYSLVVANGTVYAAGRDGNWAVLWEGGKRTDLPNGSEALSVAVSKKGDVYVAGRKNDDRPALWKNGALTELSTEEGQAESVFIYGDDIYVAGGKNSSSAKARLWKNGKETILPEGNMASSVFVY